jgi:hypothetical protein
VIAVRRGAIAALLSAAAIVGCTEISTDPKVPVSLQFDSLPALAVVIGDTMRGPDLEPTRLPVAAFSGSGSSVSDSLIRVVGIDTGSVSSFALTGGFFLTGRTLNSAVRIVAQAGGLQSQPQTFGVVKVPTSLSRFVADSSESLVYNAPDTLARYLDTRVTLKSDTTRLKGLRVKFRIVSFTDSLLDSVKLIAPFPGGRPIGSALMEDTAATVRVFAWARKGATGRGTVTLEASHKALGAPVPGSPLQFTVRLAPFVLTP